MKALFSTIFALALAFSLSACDDKSGTEPEPQNPSGKPSAGTPDRTLIRIMSFNIRTGTSDKNTANAWDKRKVGVYEMINVENPLIVGLQECRMFQRDDLEDNCPGYKGFGVVRYNPKAKTGETCSIIYDEAQCSIEKWGSFWLNEKNPDEVHTGWDAEYNRIATWAVVKVKANGKRFFFINTHLDNSGAVARREGLNLVMAKFKELNTENLPQVLTGDFNVTKPSDVFTVCEQTMKDVRDNAPTTDKIGTFNNWGSSSKVIDYIFESGFKLLEYRTINDTWKGVKYISDHYPICALMRFEK